MGTVGLTSRIASGYSRSFIVIATVTALVTFGRLHEVVLLLQPFRLGYITTLAALVALFRLQQPQAFRRITASVAGRAFGVTVLVAFLGVPGSVWPSASVKFLQEIFVHIVILFVVMSLAFQDQRASRIILIALAIDVLVAALLPFLGRSEGGRFQIGYTYDPNDTAAFFLAMVPWCIYLAMTEKGRFRLLAIGAVALSLLAVLKTGSRGGIVGIVALAPFLLYLAPPRRRAPFIAALLVGGMVFGALVRSDNRLMMRFEKTFQKEDYNFTEDEGRIAVWTRGVGYYAANPLLGVGINGFPYQELQTKRNTGFGIRQTAAHNMYVQVAAELGTPGIVSLFAMLFGSIASCARFKRKVKKQLELTGLDPKLEREYLRASMAQAAVWAVASTGFFLSLGYSAITYFVIAAAIGVSCTDLHGSISSSGRPSVSPPRARGMRGWRSARIVPHVAAPQELHSPQS